MKSSKCSGLGKLGRCRVKGAEAMARGWFVYVKELALYSQKDWQMSKSLLHKIVSDWHWLKWGLMLPSTWLNFGQAFSWLNGPNLPFVEYLIKKKIIYLAMLGLSCYMPNLVSWPEIELGFPTLGVQSLSYWTFKKVPSTYFEKLAIINYFSALLRGKSFPSCMLVLQPWTSFPKNNPGCHSLTLWDPSLWNVIVGDFLGSSVVRTPCFHCRVPRFNPGLGNWDSTCHVTWPKNNKK